MPKFKTYNQNQLMLLPPDIKDWIPSDHICFVINDIVDNLNIDCIEKTYSENGCPAYDPRMLMKTMFYAYTQGIRSSRKIERASCENIVFRYLSANQIPDHGTINLFRKNHLNELENLFSQIVILCDGLNIIDPTDISIDGDIIQASASGKNTYGKEAIAKTKKRIKEILSQAEQIDDEENKKYGNKKKGYTEMPEKLKDPETRQKEIYKLKNKLSKIEDAEEAIDKKQDQAKTKNEKQLSKNSTHNTTDPEANLMKMKNGKTFKPAYNVQVATSNQVVTGYEISDSSSDTNMLLPLIDESEKNTGKKVKKTKADAGYFSKENINGLKEKDIDGYIPDQTKALEERQERNNEIPKYDKRNFKYDEQKDEFTCPQNKQLIHKYTHKNIKKYICSNCNGCPVKDQCTKAKNRQIGIDAVFENVKQKMREKLNSDEGKKKYLERMSEVEPIFGNITYNQCANHFLCRGKPMVKIEFGLSCIAHNFVKIANWIKNQGKNIKDIQLDTLMRLQATA